MKQRVKFLDSWAHLGDPNKAALEAKYEELRTQNAKRPENQRLKDSAIKSRIDEMKKMDRYDEKPVGFSRDVSFRMGDETELPASLALKLEAAGIVAILREEKKAA